MSSDQPLDSSGGSVTSLSLLRRLQEPAEDKAAWQRMNRLYAPLVLYWCKKAGLNDADADDVIQEAFRTVYARVGEFERQRQGSFRAWLKAIARNKIGDVYKRLNKPGQAEGGTEAQLRLVQQPDLADSEQSESEETGLVFHQAIELARERFEPRTIDAFVRVVANGQAASDAATELEMTLNAVYVAKAKVLAFLRQELKGLLD